MKYFFLQWDSWSNLLWTLLSNHKTFTLLQSLKNSSSDMGSLVYDLRIFARIPFGGSFVILTPVMKQQGSLYPGIIAPMDIAYLLL